MISFSFTKAVYASLRPGRYLLQVAGCRLQVEKWTFKSE